MSLSRKRSDENKEEEAPSGRRRSVQCKVSVCRVADRKAVVLPEDRGGIWPEATQRRECFHDGTFGAPCAPLFEENLGGRHRESCNKKCASLGERKGG